jgi:DNA-binding IclR family transcriptional regulator
MGMISHPAGVGSIPRAFAVLRALADGPSAGSRITQVAQQVGLTPSSTHRALQALLEQGMVEQDGSNKLYRLSIDFFSLAAIAGNAGNLRALCKPVLLRLCASLGDSIFLLVRSGFDAVCLDRSEGPFPIRSFTGDVGGRVALGVGQGSLAILAHLPDAECEEVIRFNLARLREYGVYDEVYLRTEMARARQLGYVSSNTGLLEGMAGVAVPVRDSAGRAVAALSVGTLASRLNPERLPTVVELLKREASKLSSQINPFDAALRRPSQSLASSAAAHGGPAPA